LLRLDYRFLNRSLNHNATRAVLAVGYDLKLTHNAILRLKFQYQELSYQDMTEENTYVSYNLLF